MNFLLINGLRLAIQETGPSTGFPIVFLHGFPFSQAMWAPQVDLLKQEYRVITYDHRGHGRSEEGDGQYTLEFLVDDFFGVLDQMKIDRATVCGLSMGGYIALRAIERQPERFRALVLCDTQSAADSNEGKLKRGAAIKIVKQQGTAAFAEGFVKAVFAPISFADHPRVVADIQGVIQSTSPLGIGGALLALASRTDTTAVLPKIQVPTLILVGEQDAITPPTVAQAMQEKIPGSELHVIPRAGHLSNLENPEAFNRHLLDFLKKSLS